MRNDLKNHWHPEESWAGLIPAASAKIRKATLQSLEKVGLGYLSLGRLGILNLLNDKPTTQSELCEQLGLKAPTVLDALRRLQKRGVIQVAPHSEDGRKKQWSLSSQGRKDLLRARNILRHKGFRIDRFFKKMDVSQKELTKFRTILKEFLNLPL